ncbi:P-type conjugative transfer protein TrbJ, partial [Shinella yambaruensis]
KKLGLAMAVAGSLAGFIPTSITPVAQAQWVVTDPAHTLQTIVAEVARAADAAAQIQNQIKQYEDMLKQGRIFDASVFDKIVGLIQELAGLYGQSQGLAGQLPEFDEQFRSVYKDYETYLASIGEEKDFAVQQYDRWNKTNFDSMRTSMRSAGINVSAIDDEEAVLARLVERSATAEGRMQAVQAGNEIAAMQVQQLQKLRLMYNDMIQSQNQYLSNEVERRTIEDAFLDDFTEDEMKDGQRRGF